MKASSARERMKPSPKSRGGSSALSRRRQRANEPSDDGSRHSVQFRRSVEAPTKRCGGFADGPSWISQLSEALRLLIQNLTFELLELLGGDVSAVSELS
jgi:hypothetical protein